MNHPDPLFTQTPPRLGNQYRDDCLLVSWLHRMLPLTRLREFETEIEELGAEVGGPLYRLQLNDRLHEPRLTQWDAWGDRIDTVELTPLWREAERLTLEYGLVATAYERRHGYLSRIEQFAKVYLFHPSSDVCSTASASARGPASARMSARRTPLNHALPIRSPPTSLDTQQSVTHASVSSRATRLA